MHQVDVNLLLAVAYQESRMNPDARGAAGEIGMFQIMPNTAKHWAEVTGNAVPGERELFRVRTNAEIAAWYLRRGLDRFAHRADPLPFALAYYNAGPGRAVEWEQRLPDRMAFHEFIPFPSTRKYVMDITRRIEEGLPGDE
jgi:soluble lytic murein transglycosylase